MNLLLLSTFITILCGMQSRRIHNKPQLIQKHEHQIKKRRLYSDMEGMIIYDLEESGCQTDENNCHFIESFDFSGKYLCDGNTLIVQIWETGDYIQCSGDYDDEYQFDSHECCPSEPTTTTTTTTKITTTNDKYCLTMGDLPLKPSKDLSGDYIHAGNSWPMWQISEGGKITAALMWTCSDYNMDGYWTFKHRSCTSELVCTDSQPQIGCPSRPELCQSWGVKSYYNDYVTRSYDQGELEQYGFSLTACGNEL